MIDFDRKMKACGKKVVLNKLERTHERINDGIIIPEAVDKGYRLTKAEILSLGYEVTFEKYGLSVGDIVLYDTFSVFYNHHPIVVTNVENVIGKMNLKK